MWFCKDNLGQESRANQYLEGDVRSSEVKQRVTFPPPAITRLTIGPTCSAPLLPPSPPSHKREAIPKPLDLT